jgi:signal transduction histidine kinase
MMGMMDRYKILVVEDENIVALDIKNRIQSMGYDIAGTESRGDDAVKFVSEHNVDLVLMDIKLQGNMDGIETAREIRKIKDIPIVYLTAYSDKRSIEHALETGPYGYILKPYEDRELAVAIELAKYKHQVQRQLLNAKDEAEKASRVKSEFLANMSHELRTPLNSIIGMTELSLDICTDSQQEEYLSILRQSANILLNIINSILEFASEPEEVSTKETRIFNLDHVLKESFKAVSPQAGKKDLRLIYNPADREINGTFIGKPDDIQNIMSHLLQNAIKFTERGRIILSVSLEEIAAGKRRVIVSVEDSGIGIPKEKLQTIFEPFTQVDASATRHYGGTGIGLAVIRKKLQLLDGTIEAVSKENEGSTFTVKLPLIKQREDFPVKTKQPLFKDTLIRIVCSDNLQAEIITRTFTDAGVLSVFSDGQDAKSQQDAKAAAVIWVIQSNGKQYQKEIENIRSRSQHAHKLGFLLISPFKEPADTAEEDDERIRTVFEPVTADDLIYNSLELLKKITVNDKISTRAPKKAASPLTILLVEDDRINKLVNKKMIQRMGHTVETAENGMEALEVLETKAIDLVLMDIQMPIMDGLEATRQIRSGMVDDIDKDIPILALTAHALEEDRIASQEAGMDGFLSKPFDSEILYDAIFSAYNKKKESSARENKDRGLLIREFLHEIPEELDELGGEDLQKITDTVKNYRTKFEDAGNAHIAEDLFRINLAARRGDQVEIKQIIAKLKKGQQ